MKRANRQAGPQVTQRYGADGHLHLARRVVGVYYFNLIIMYLLAISQFLLCQEAQSGVAPSYIETYIRGHQAQILHSQSCFAVRMPRRLWLVK
jgi:hypothetical protein